MADADNSVENLTILDLVIPKNGYIYIYVANESPTDVYFDNLQIIHEKSNVLELSDYYPYGLQNESLSYTGLSFDPANNYHYQDKELQTALGLNMHEFGLRHYDATLGRWRVQDPFMQFYNPYLAMGNNPVSYIDPDGGKVFSSYSKGENEQPIQGGDAGGWRSALSQYMMKSPFSQQLFQGAHGTATIILNALGSNPTMMVGVFIDILSDGTTVINTSSGNFDVNAFNNASNGSNNDPNKDFTLPGYTLHTVNIEDLRTNSTFVSSYAYNNFDVYAHERGGYDWGRVGNPLTAGGVAYYGLEKSISNSKYWVDAKGSIRSTDLLNKGSNGKYVRGVQGLRNSQAAAARAASNYAVAGKVVGGLGMFVTGYQFLDGQISGTEASIDLIMGSIGFTGWGTPVSLMYFGGKFLYEYSTGNTLFEKP